MKQETQVKFDLIILDTDVIVRSGHKINPIDIQVITEYFSFIFYQREEFDDRSCPAFNCSSKEWREKRKRLE